MVLGTALTGQAVFEAVVKRLAASVVIGAGKNALAALRNVEVDFGEHLRQSYERCTCIRTILNRDESVSLLSLYVNLKFSHSRTKILDDYDLIEEIFENKRTVITGVGGGGKTMFMKYLWISIFETRQSTVPLFIELRRFNEMTSVDFQTFLFRTITGADASVKADDFEKALKEGAFSLLLDGFDEINEERRNLVEIEIMKLARNYPRLIIVVSSRPDDKFDGWQAFNNYRVLPLSKKQVVDLVGKLKYDDKIKRKFVQRIKNDLYQNHESFLSSPLLATMMLLTFDQFADIPEKVYLFYDQAFDTLFAKHDATKEAYKRKSYTSLSIDVFKKLLAYFCLISYYDQIHEFTDTEVRNFIGKAIKMLNQKVEQEAFLQDLKESVCILQKEGLHWVFTHRSFQEYFAAYCLSNLVSKRMGDIFPHLISRAQDTVLGMCFDMNQETLEAEYVFPTTKNLVKAFDGAKEEDIFRRYCEVFQCGLFGNRNIRNATSESQQAGRLFLHSQLPNWRFVLAIRELYKFPEPKMPAGREFLEGEFVASISPPSTRFHDLIHIPLIGVEDHDNSWIEPLGIKKATKGMPLKMTPDFYFDAIARRHVRDLRTLLKSLESKNGRRSRSIEEIFHLGE